VEGGTPSPTTGAAWRRGGRAGFRGLQRQLYSDVTGYLPDDILTKVDRMSMAVSLEARVPFLDHELVEYAMALPDEWKLRGTTAKWILRRAMDGFLPRETLRRGKEGFSMPMKNWLGAPSAPCWSPFPRPSGSGAGSTAPRWNDWWPSTWREGRTTPTASGAS
jgi:asparagine synthase (glutamine-hydrolysing)